MTPNFNEEKKLWKQGFEYVAGLDEAGRGPLAGPVVAAAVIVPACRQAGDLLLKTLQSKFSDINDSKKLSEKQRDFLFEKLTQDKFISFGVGIISENVIDKVNILQASKLAMQQALEKLKPDFLLLDGNFLLDMNISQKAVVRGDSKVFSIAAASIIAKVTRDRIMKEMHEKYPAYGFDKHKGYGTKTHLASIQKHGPSKIHRKTFYPVSNFV